MAAAAKYTPLTWRTLVVRHPDKRFVGQRKNTTWIRDRLPHNFVDDTIDRLRGRVDSVDVIVQLSRREPPDSTRIWLAGFGRITYFGALVSCAFVERVPMNRIDSLAAHPTVAMVERQIPFRPALDVATRATGATASSDYPDQVAAHDLDLDGTGIRIAVIDFGVWNEHDALRDAFVAGFDASKYAGDEILGATTPPADCATGSDPLVEEGDGCTDPDPTTWDFGAHATKMAGVALARPAAGADCREPSGEAAANNCGGMAPAAELIDVKVCADSCEWGDPGAVMRGIDWVGLNASTWNIRLASISLFDGADNDGESAHCKAVDYLASLGVIPVVCLGNASELTVGAREVSSPGAASYAITVSATDDAGTVDRSTDEAYSLSLTGPRRDYIASGDILALKPDLAAPGENVKTTTTSASGASTYWSESGTSIAAAITAGAVALLLQRQPDLDALCTKHLLQATADKTWIPAAGWDEALGKGLLDVAAAAAAMGTQDIRFESCVGSATQVGSPCPLPSGIARWNNYLDIETASPPVVGERNEIRAKVRNDGPTDDSALIEFGIYVFGAGTKTFHRIGVQEVVLPAGVATSVSQSWTPEDGSHQCAQVAIHYGFDSDFRNNVTQRNLSVAPSEYRMDVENPFTTRARFRVVPTAAVPPGWDCTVDDPAFELGGTSRPHTVTISFHAEQGAQPGDRATCDVAVYGWPVGARDSTLVGGVTVETYVPRLCRLVGRLLGRNGLPLEGATLRFIRKLPEGLVANVWERDRKAVTDADGVFSLVVFPEVAHRLRIETRGFHAETEIRPPCGLGALRLRLDDRGIVVSE